MLSVPTHPPHVPVAVCRAGPPGLGARTPTLRAHWCRTCAFTCNTLVERARFLLSENQQIGESEALRIVYRFLRYDGMGLPETVAEYGIEEAATLAYRIPVQELVIRDLVKADSAWIRTSPRYPIIHGVGWPRGAIDGICEQGRVIGHDGIVWQGTDDIVEFDLK